MKISATRLKMYLTCPRQFKYAYLDELPTVLTGALAFGQTIHRTLHEIHLGSAESESPMAVDSAFAVFDRLWRETLQRDKPVFKTAEESEAYWNLADDILRRYVTAQLAKPKDTPVPLVLEFPFEISWFDATCQEHQLCGIIDRVDEGRQGLIIVDFKSGKRKPKADSIGSDLQLLLYAYALENVLNQPVEQIAVLHLRDGTLLSAEPAPDALHRLMNEVLPNVVRGIAQQQFAPHYGYWCRYCDYKTVCDAEGPPEPTTAEFAEAHEMTLAG